MTQSRASVESGGLPRLYRPTWAEIDLSKLKANLKKLKKRARTDVLLVVKADGYGHGAVEVARAAENSSLACGFGVSSVEEGIILREAGLLKPILILGSLYPFESTMAAIRYRLTPTVASLEGARLIEQAAEAMGRLRPEGAARPLSCHLKIDTGMGRVGVSWPAGRRAAEYLRRAPGVRLDGVFTHLASAENDERFTRMQLRRFRGAVEEIEASGLPVKCRHAANSAAAMRFPESRWDMIRPGLAAYGLYPGFEPVLSLKTRVVFLKTAARGVSISYGRRYRASKKTRIATLPVGYGDGLPRILSLPERGRRRSCVLVGGVRCPLVGAMTMDMTMVDVTAVAGVQVGDEAVVMGEQGRLCIGADELAESAATIPYEIVTHLKSRLPRVFLR